MNQSDIFENNRFILKIWLTQMIIQFIMNESQYRNEAAKILYVSSFLKESVLKWMQSWFDDYVINSHSKKEKKIQ